MLSYPSIMRDVIKTPIYAFDKLDGSNIRAEYSRKRGFNKFGSRTRLLDEQEENLGEAITIFNRELNEPLSKIFHEMRIERATCFMEFYGENSFAGLHINNEKHYLKLFDISLFKKGFMLPKDFLKTFEDKVPTPNLLYTGDPLNDFVNRVKNGKLEGMTFEGVVCKGTDLIKNRHIRFKLKNKAWLNKLKDYCKGDEELFNKLV